jgi:hypothetical protein
VSRCLAHTCSRSSPANLRMPQPPSAFSSFSGPSTSAPRQEGRYVGVPPPQDFGRNMLTSVTTAFRSLGHLRTRIPRSSALRSLSSRRCQISPRTRHFTGRRNMSKTTARAGRVTLARAISRLSRPL